jgi:hypothetical protein
MELTEIGAKKLEEALNSTFGSGDGGKGSAAGADSGKKKKLNEFERMQLHVAEATAALHAENAALAGIAGKLFTLEGI